MATRYLVCQTCGGKVPWAEKDKMDVYVKRTSNGKGKNLYYHKGKCYDEGSKKHDFLDKEYDEQTELDLVIKEIHETIHPLPAVFWQMLQDVRNGTQRYQRVFKKHYKKGVPYRVLKEAYILAKDDIRWQRLNKRFKTLNDELRYCLKIAHSRVNDAHRKLQRNEHMRKTEQELEKKQAEQVFEETSHSGNDSESAWRKHKARQEKDENDISHILGDD